MISEGEISRELGLGRTPVREAIARLKYIGFVEVHHRRGVLVSNLDPIRHLELLEVRRPLELDIVRHIIDRGTEEDVAELDAVMDRVWQAAERGERLLYFKAKRSLHDAEVRMARNSVLTTTITSLHAQSRRFWQAYEPTSSFKKGAALHLRIIDGIRKRAPDAATAAVEDLFTFLQNITIEVVRRNRRI